MSDQAKQLRAMFLQANKIVEVITFISQVPNNISREIVYQGATLSDRILYLCDQQIDNSLGESVTVMSFNDFKASLLLQDADTILQQFDKIIIETQMIFNQTFIEKLRITTHPIFVFESDPKRLPLHYEIIKYIQQLNHQSGSLMLISTEQKYVASQIENELIQMSHKQLDFKLLLISLTGLQTNEPKDLYQSVSKQIHINIEQLRDEHSIKDMADLKEQLNQLKIS